MRIIATIVILLASVPIFGRHISPDDAAKSAIDFFETIRCQNSGNLSNRFAIQNPEYIATTASGKEAFYAFNRSDDNGFVIIMADDRVPAIAGYSDTGRFSISEIPENMKFWLTGLISEMELLYSGKAKSIYDSLDYPDITHEEFPSEVTPLLRNTMWSQDYPFNAMCPPLDNNKCLSGCIATSHGQVMYYWQHPISGSGSHSYWDSKSRNQLSADFESTKYDWEAMKPVYVAPYTEHERDAIATLLYHIGVASDMSYGNSSGATPERAAFAMSEYFGYSPSLQLRYRDDFPYRQWIAMMRTELSEGRPIIYGGRTPSEGHSFVIDGYDDNDMFHVNWGWRGSYNGYFRITLLSPGSRVITSEEGYNIRQHGIFGMQPVKEGDIDMGGYFAAESATASFTSDKMNLQVKNLINHGCRPLRHIGVGLFTPDMKFVHGEITSIPGGLEAGSAWNTIKLTAYKPDTIADGNYFIMPFMMYNPTDSSTIVPAAIQQPNTFPSVRVTSGRYDIMPQGLDRLKLTDLYLEGRHIERFITASFKLENIGSAPFYGRLSLELIDTLGHTIKSFKGEILSLAVGDTMRSEFSILVPFESADSMPRCTMRIIDPKGILLASKVFNLKKMYSVHTLLKCPEWHFTNLSNNCVNPSDIRISATITNIDDDYNDNLFLMVRDSDNEYLSYVAATKRMYIAAGDTKTVELRGAYLLSPGNYKFSLAYSVGNGVLYHFDYDSPIEIQVLDASSSTAITEIDNSGQADYYTLQGLRVTGNLLPGIYIKISEGKSTKIVVQ